MNNSKFQSILLGALLVLITHSGHTANQHEIIIQGFEFVPNQLEVAVGDRVTWINRDIVAHNIVLESKQTKLSPDLAKNEQYTYTVQAGLDYQCGLHPSMLGTLSVIPALQD